MSKAWMGGLSLNIRAHTIDVRESGGSDKKQQEVNLQNNLIDYLKISHYIMSLLTYKPGIICSTFNTDMIYFNAVILDPVWRIIEVSKKFYFSFYFILLNIIQNFYYRFYGTQKFGCYLAALNIDIDMPYFTVQSPLKESIHFCLAEYSKLRGARWKVGCVLKSSKILCQLHWGQRESLNFVRFRKRGCLGLFVPVSLSLGISKRGLVQFGLTQLGCDTSPTFPLVPLSFEYLALMQAHRHYKMHKKL